MKNTFRQSMSWLHTWGSLWFAWILFAVFFTGTLGVFDDAISHWMRDPLAVTAASEGAPPPDRLQAARVGQAFLEKNAPRAEFWSMGLPDEENTKLRVFWRDNPQAEFQDRELDPVTGEDAGPSKERKTEGGHHFVHMHFEFHAGDAGIWLVGVAAMVMLVALVSGIVVHKKIFVDFFTFRPGKGQRSWLDSHNALSVLTLPFQFMIVYTGVVAFASIYMPAAAMVRYHGDLDHFFADIQERPAPRQMQNVAAPVMPLPGLVTAAENRIGREARFISVSHPGDASASARIFMRGDEAEMASRLRGSNGSVQFDAVSGEILDTEMPGEIRGAGAFSTFQSMRALHFVTFGGYTIKWLYFICGMAGAAMLATGAILFMVKRRKKPAGEFGASTARVYRVIDALNVSGIAGLMLASVGYFWINRLVPVALPEREVWEVGLFFALWFLTLVHASLRPVMRGWVEQLGATAFLCLALPLINMLTTGDNFVAALARGDGEAAGVELTAMASGLLCIAAARFVRRKSQQAPQAARARAGKPDAAADADVEAEAA